MIGLVLPGNIWFSPYLNIYTKVLDEQGVDYTIISWNRDGNDKKIGYQFQVRAGANGGVEVIKPYFQYISFIKRTIREQKIDKLIIFGPQLGVFLSTYLWKYFKGRYIFDYRDLSIEQKTLCKLPFRLLLKNAAAIFISSPGFAKYLPQGFDYKISHNFNVEMVRKVVISNKVASLSQPTEILTIGGIRDYTSNIEVIKALANKEGFHISFVGKGPSAPLLEKFVTDNGINNVIFKGFYQKEEESSYVKKSTILNIFYPRKKSHDSALSNRFYNSLIFRKPMLVTKYTTQGDYCEKYRLGLAVESCEGLDDKIKDYIASYNAADFVKRSNGLLMEFLDDYNKFEEIVIKFAK